MKTDDPTLPIPDEPGPDGNDDAVNLIRGKLDALYSHEPDAVTEAIESMQAPAKGRSKHQKYMTELATSGKPFAQIQVEWHEYYNGLSNKEKHEVWEEFYSAQAHKPQFSPAAQVLPAPVPSGPMIGVIDVPAASPEPKPKTRKKAKPQSVADIKDQITSKVSSRGRLSRKQHLKSISFGLAAGGVTVMVLLFGFFNERIIAPFITPSRNVSSTPLILDANSAVGADPKIIIPKINVEVPVVYDVRTIDEAAVQKGLERGVVHYATTSNPGELGNGAIFGHSSNNILNRGDFKFAFVLLKRLENGDTFYIEKEGVRYVYKIFDKKIVSPNDVSVLTDVEGKSSTMVLITCDPPGTTINRLVVYGEQISPDPTKNIASTAVATDVQPDALAGNPESLWSRIWGALF